MPRINVASSAQPAVLDNGKNIRESLRRDWSTFLVLIRATTSGLLVYGP